MRATISGVNVRTGWSRRAVTIALLASLGLLGATGAWGQQGSTPPLTIEAVAVDPPAPGPDTLCKLTVTVRNNGTEIASQLAFGVTVDGNSLPVYGNQLFMVPLPPGESTEIKLYNFWSTETSRPAPSGSELPVRVELREAQWMKIQVIEEDGEEIEEWEPLGAVDGLPVSSEVVLPFGS